MYAYLNLENKVVLQVLKTSFFLIYKYFLFYVLCQHLSVPHACSVCRDDKRMAEPLELEFVCVCAMYTWGGGCVNVPVHEQKPEEDIRCPTLSLFVLFP